MKGDYPPELKGYHATTMLHAFLVAIISLSAWAWGFYRQEVYSAADELQTVLQWMFVGGLGLMVVTFLYKALMSLPSCPKCHRRMKQLETISITSRTVFNLRHTSKWRIVGCSYCDLRFRIPGLL